MQQREADNYTQRGDRQTERVKKHNRELDRWRERERETAREREGEREREIHRERER